MSGTEYDMPPGGAAEAIARQGLLWLRIGGQMVALGRLASGAEPPPSVPADDFCSPPPPPSPGSGPGCPGTGSALEQ